MKKAIMLFIIVLLLPVMAFAAGTGGERSVKSTETMQGGNFIVRPTSAFNNPDNCDTSTAVVVLTTNNGQKAIMAGALTALSLDSTIKPQLNGCWTAPWGPTIPIVTNMQTFK